MRLFEKGDIKKKVVPAIIIFLFSLHAFSQQKISGVIRDDNRVPLSGVTVTNKNKGKITVTSPDGGFDIIADKGDKLEFSFVGYKTVEIKVNDETPINLSLPLIGINLDEVVVTGYTSQRIKDIVGSVSIVKPKDLTAVPAGQVEQMLQGRVAGLTVITEGEPGAPANIRLHGIGNFGNATPLYIIDGIQGDVNSINPNDIESLQVLKDAAAYSIYGVRGANGVLVITTKKGRQGKTRITYDGYFGLQEPLKKGLDLLTPQENANLYWLGARNSGQVDASGNPSNTLYGNGPTPVLPDYLFAGPNSNALFEGNPLVADSLYNLNPDLGEVYQIVKFNKSGTDWFHEMFKPAWSQNHNMTVSGANDKNNYLFSLGYLDQQGTLLNTYLKRYTARVNTEFTVLDAVHIGENLQLAYVDNPKSSKFNPATSAINDVSSALTTNPYLPVYDIKGAYNGGYFPGGGFGGLANNPVAVRVLAKDNKGKTWQAFGNVFAEINFLKNFTAKTSFGGTLTNFYNYTFAPSSYDYPNSGYPNGLSEASGYLSSTTWTNTVSFSKIVAGVHSVQILAGTEVINNNNREEGGSAPNLAFTDPNYWLLSNGDATKAKNYSIASISKLYSLISRIEYSYKSKYLITGNLRKDGSSIFNAKNRYGWFPSIGVAWRIGEERFLSNATWITDLKLRASYGKTGFYGNTDPSNQFTLYGGSPGDAFYDINGNSSGTITRGFRVIRIGNEKTSWQQDIVTNVGVESILWNGKLSITADWYRKESRGLLFPILLPDLLGDVIPPNVNAGNIINTGIDLSVGTKGSFAKDFGWDAQINFSHYKNTIKKLNKIPYFDDVFGLIRNEVGYPISSFYGYKIIGLFRDNDDVAKSPTQDEAAPGRFKYLDANNDGKISDSDRIHFGNPHPKFTLGINLGIHFKNFDFSTFLYGSFGNQVLNIQEEGVNIFTGADGTYSKTALYNSWSPQHLNAKSPIPEMSYNFSNMGDHNSYTLENGTYLRNKSVMLGYTFPKSVLEKSRIDRLRIYLQVVNLFTITHYSGLDPELSNTSLSPLSDQAMKSSFGIDGGNYPNNQKQYVFGLTLTL